MTSDDNKFDWTSVDEKRACPICGFSAECYYSLSRMQVFCIRDATGCAIGDIPGYLHCMPMNDKGNPEFPMPSYAKKINTHLTKKKKEPDV